MKNKAQNNKSQTLNLTQLQRNKRKQADKTSGRKQPRFRDVDVEGADDADDDVVSQLVACVTGQPATATDTVAADIDLSVCHACDRQEPPPREKSGSTPIPSPGWGATSAHGGTTVCVWDE